MTEWADGRMAVFDLETTSPDPHTARIVSGAVITVGPEGLIDTKAWLINPGCEIPAEAIAVHGITNEQASEGMDPIVAIAEMWAALGSSWAQGMPVIAFNGAFDLTLLAAEMRRHDHPAIDQATGVPPVGPMFDPYVVDKHEDKYRSGKRTLTHMAAHYEVTQGPAHTASGDCITTARIAWKQLRLWPHLATMDLRDLHQQQAEWYAAQAHGYAQYLARKGDTEGAARVSTGWPFQTRPVGAVS